MRMLSSRSLFASIRLALVAGGAVATTASAAAAQEEETWRCSTPYGSYDQSVLQVSPGSRVLSGRIQFHSGDMGKVWNPTATIAFTDSALPTHGGCFCNGIRASMYRNLPGIVTFEMIFNGEYVGVGQADVGKAITFKVSVDDGGLMTVQIGKTNPVFKTVQLGHAQSDTVYMSCSGGDVSFLNVQAS
jgi:hypothetical protein